MQTNLPAARPKIAVWHISKWEFCQKCDLRVRIHYRQDNWKPFAGTGNLLWPRKDQGLQREGHFLRVGDQKLMGSSFSRRKSEPESKVSFAVASLQCAGGSAVVQCLAQPPTAPCVARRGLQTWGWLGQRYLCGCKSSPTAGCSFQK